MKKIMLVAGGNWQCSIARKIKEMGYYLICSNLYPDSPAFRWADASAVANVLDYEKNFEIANQYHPDAIITDQSDIAVRTVAKLNETLGLHGIGCEIASRFSSKYLMREFCKKNNLPCPAYRLCGTIDEAIDFLHTYGKSVIKPLDSQSSRGVYTVTSEKDIRDLFEITRNCSICEKKVLIEEFIGGTEFTVDAIKTEAGAETLAISEKKHYKDYPNVASQLLFTEFNPNFDYDALRNVNNSLIEAMGLPFGLTHAEYKFDKGKYFLIEIAARGGGTNISSTIAPYMSGIDSNALLIRMAFGESVGKIRRMPSNGKCSCLEFFSFKEGTAKQIIGDSFLQANPNVLEYLFNFKPGEKVPAPSDDSKRPGHFIAGASGIDVLNEVRKQIHNNVYVQYS